jgi:hypothetical protein
MAQQTTQFPPGGNLTNWVPGFSTSGHPIRGLRVDNTSGSWLGVQIPSLAVQYVPPYTLAWSMTLLTPLSNVTILSGGPPGSVSTSTGDNVTVYAYSESVGDSNGNTYYTPVTASKILQSNLTFIGIGPGVTSVLQQLPPIIGSSYRLSLWTIIAKEQIIGDCRSYLSCWLEGNAGPYSFILNVTLNPSNGSLTIPIGDIILPAGHLVQAQISNYSTTLTYDVQSFLNYSVM